MTYSQYAYVEAFLDMKQKSWINAHVHMYEYFGGVARILVPDNCKTAVIHNGGWKDQQINETYQELAEHYGTAIIPARVRTPKDKPNAEGTILHSYLQFSVFQKRLFRSVIKNCSWNSKRKDILWRLRIHFDIYLRDLFCRYHFDAHRSCACFTCRSINWNLRIILDRIYCGSSYDSEISVQYR